MKYTIEIEVGCDIPSLAVSEWNGAHSTIRIAKGMSGDALRFVMRHETAHIVEHIMDIEHAEAEAHNAKYNLAQDYLINEILKTSGIK